MFPIVASSIFVRKRGKVILGPIDFSLSVGGMTIVIGPNGAGKTTFLRALHGIERISDGTLESSVDPQTTFAQQSFVFQTPIIMRRNVEENLLYPLKLVKTPMREAREMVRVMAGRIGLEDALLRPARVLSGGEKQKLALGRALMRNPKLLFLDEPCASLDGRATREIEQILISEREKGTKIVMSTHDMGQARRLADQVLFMFGGEIHEEGSAPEFFAAPNTSKAHAFLNGDIIE